MVSIFSLQKVSVQIEILRSFKFYGKRIGAWPSPFLGRPDSTITLGKIISLNYTSTSIDSAKDKVGVMHLSKNSFRIWVQKWFEGKTYFNTKDWFDDIFLKGAFFNWFLIPNQMGFFKYVTIWGANVPNHNSKCEGDNSWILWVIHPFFFSLCLLILRLLPFKKGHNH